VAARKLTFYLYQGPVVQKEIIVEKGDHVKIMGKDGFYVFVAEIQGRAILRVSSATSLKAPTFDVPINRVISLES
jgi:hypothetical protein